jgi:hypothetical protein
MDDKISGKYFSIPHQLQLYERIEAFKKSPQHQSRFQWGHGQYEG